MLHVNHFYPFRLLILRCISNLKTRNYHKKGSQFLSIILSIRDVHYNDVISIIFCQNVSYLICSPYRVRYDTWILKCAFYYNICSRVNCNHSDRGPAIHGVFKHIMLVRFSLQSNSIRVLHLIPRSVCKTR